MLHKKSMYVHQETVYYAHLYNTINRAVNRVTSSEDSSGAINKFRFCYYPARTILERIKLNDYD